MFKVGDIVFLGAMNSFVKLRDTTDVAICNCCHGVRHATESEITRYNLREPRHFFKEGERYDNY